MENVSRWQLVGMFILLTSTGAQLLGEGVTTWLWAAAVAITSAGCVLLWRQLQSAWSVPWVDELYASAIALVVVLLAFGGLVWLQIVNTDAFYIVAHGTLGGWFIVFIAERVDPVERIHNTAGT